MVDDELAEIRRRRMEQLQRQAMDQQTVEERLCASSRSNHRSASRSWRSSSLKRGERLNTIKLTRPEFAKAVEQQLVMLAQGGRIRQRITDDQLKSLLVQLTPSKKEFRITRK